eukprot:g8618.t1 g8618   contig3:506090-507058(+)
MLVSVNPSPNGRENIPRLKHDGCNLGGEHSGMEHHIAAQVEIVSLNQATTLEDLQLLDDLFGIGTALCLVVHKRRIDKMLDVLCSFKWSDVMMTIVAGIDLEDIQGAKTLNMLDIEEKNLAWLTKNGSIDHSTVLTTMLSIKLGHYNRNLLPLLNTTAAAYVLDVLLKAKSINELEGLKDENEAILLKHGDKKSLSSLISLKRGQNDHKAERSNWAKTMIRNRNTKRQEEFEKTGCKGSFCGFCGATKFFKESSRVRGTCLENCYLRAYGFAANKHSEWKAKKPTQEEMDALNKTFTIRQTMHRYKYYRKLLQHFGRIDHPM